jgi:hypothetical protein
MNIHIEQTHALSGQHQSRGEIYGHGALADASLARQHNHLMPNATESGLEFPPVFEFFVAFVFLALGCGAALISAGLTRYLATMIAMVLMIRLFHV